MSSSAFQIPSSKSWILSSRPLRAGFMIISLVMFLVMAVEFALMGINRCIAVGDERFLQSYVGQYVPFVVGPATNIQTAPVKANLANKVKVVVPSVMMPFSQNLACHLKVVWPTHGAVDATTSNVETFMKGLLNHLHRRSVAPLRRQDSLKEVYILSLLDEDQRSLASGGFGRHWGLFAFNGQAEYHVHLLGKGSRKSLRNSQNVDYLSTRWCVVNNSKNDPGNSMVSALEACSADCSALLSPGGSCFNLSWPVNVPYAFNCYYQQHDQSADGCDFGGLGLITTGDPSVDRCRFFCSDSNFLCCIPSGVVFDLLCCFDSRISLRIFVHLCAL